MGATARVTVTLPFELLEGIDRFEQNRSRFIAEAVAHELVNRRREQLKRSLANPHPEASELADVGLAAWASSLPAGDDDLVDVNAGAAVRWVEGRGWVAESA
jgi:predicted alpha/beta-fold hydrolase